MTIDRNQHTPSVTDKITFRATFETIRIRGGEAGRSMSLELINENIPLLKQFVENCKLFKADHDVKFTKILFEEIYRHGQLDAEHIEIVTDRLDDHEGVKLFIAYANEAAERSFSKRSKAMLALYSGKIVAKPDLLERPESATILSALSSMNDFDLIYFDILMNYKEKHKERMTNAQHAYMNISSLKGVSTDEIETRLTSYSSSIQKLISLQIISQTPGSFGPNGDILVESSPYTDTFHELYKEYCVLYEKPQQEPSE